MLEHPLLKVALWGGGALGGHITTITTTTTTTKAASRVYIIMFQLDKVL
jgi:hypothetical protein